MAEYTDGGVHLLGKPVKQEPNVTIKDIQSVLKDFSIWAKKTQELKGKAVTELVTSGRLRDIDLNLDRGTPLKLKRLNLRSELNEFVQGLKNLAGEGLQALDGVGSLCYPRNPVNGDIIANGGFLVSRNIREALGLTQQRSVEHYPTIERAIAAYIANELEWNGCRNKRDQIT